VPQTSKHQSPSSRIFIRRLGSEIHVRADARGTEEANILVYVASETIPSPLHGNSPPDSNKSCRPLPYAPPEERFAALGVCVIS
jgi:hypothetical protein